MASEVLRKLIDGVWRTVVADAGGNGGSQPFLSATKHLSSADLLALNVTRPEIVAAPGANKILIPMWAWTVYTFVTTPYSNGGVFFAIDSVFGFDNSNLLTLQNDNSGIGLDQASSQLAFLKSEKWETLAGSDIVGPIAGLADQALVALVAASHPLTTGDGTLDITLTYSILELA